MSSNHHRLSIMRGLETSDFGRQWRLITPVMHRCFPGGHGIQLVTVFSLLEFYFDFEFDTSFEPIAKFSIKSEVLVLGSSDMVLKDAFSEHGRIMN